MDNVGRMRCIEEPTWKRVGEQSGSESVAMVWHITRMYMSSAWLEHRMALMSKVSWRQVRDRPRFGLIHGVKVVGPGPLYDLRCILLLHGTSTPSLCLSCPYWTHIMHHGEDSTVSYVVWLHQGQDGHQGRSSVQLHQQNCTENRIVVQSLFVAAYRWSKCDSGKRSGEPKWICKCFRFDTVMFAGVLSRLYCQCYFTERMYCQLGLSIWLYCQLCLSSCVVSGFECLCCQLRLSAGIVSCVWAPVLSVAFECRCC